MSNKRQCAANQDNARRSTGPKTRAGKERSRLNRMSHGLSAQTSVLPTDPVEQRLVMKLQEVAQSAPLVGVLRDLARAHAALNRVRVYKIKIFDVLERALRDVGKGDLAENLKHIDELIQQIEQILNTVSQASRRADRYESKAQCERRQILKMLVDVDDGGEL